MEKIFILLLLFCTNIQAMDPAKKRKITIIKKANRYTKKYDLENLQVALNNADRLITNTQSSMNLMVQEIPYNLNAYYEYKKLAHQEKRLEVIKAGIERAIEMKKAKIQKQLNNK